MTVSKTPLLGRPSRLVASLRFGLALALAVLLVSLPACESSLGRSLRGARLYATGTEALDRGAFERAILDLEKAAELVPEASEVQNHLGIARWRSGDLAGARVAFTRAVELDCDNAAAQANLAGLDAATQE